MAFLADFVVHFLSEGGQSKSLADSDNLFERHMLVSNSGFHYYELTFGKILRLTFSIQNDHH